MLKSVAETTKSLPGIILDSQSTVDGNLVTENTDNVLAKDLQTMLDKSIRTCRTDDQQVVNVKLKLNSDVTAANAMIVKLNGMDTSNFVLKDSRNNFHVIPNVTSNTSGAYCSGFNSSYPNST